MIENRRVQELPLNGRNALVAGAARAGGAVGRGADRQRASATAARSSRCIRINGSPLATNNFLVDGLSSTNPSSRREHQPERRRRAGVQGPDQHHVLEYGYTLGGVVNLVTKSGTNEFHGSLYDFFRNDSLDANSWANTRAGRPEVAAALQPVRRLARRPGRCCRKRLRPLGFDGRGPQLLLLQLRGLPVHDRARPASTPCRPRRCGAATSRSCATRSAIRSRSTTRRRRARTRTARVPPRSVSRAISFPASRLDPVRATILAFYPLPNRAPDNVILEPEQLLRRGLEQARRSTNTRRASITGFSDRKQLLGALRLLPAIHRQRHGESLSRPARAPTATIPSAATTSCFSDRPQLRPRSSTNSASAWRGRFSISRWRAPGSGCRSSSDCRQSCRRDASRAIGNGLPDLQHGHDRQARRPVWQLFDSLTWLRGNHSFKFGTEMRWTQAEQPAEEQARPARYTFPDDADGQRGAGAGTADQHGQPVRHVPARRGRQRHRDHASRANRRSGKAYSFYVNDDGSRRAG